MAFAAGALVAGTLAAGGFCASAANGASAMKNTAIRDWILCWSVMFFPQGFMG